MDHSPGFLKLVEEVGRDVKEVTIDEVARRLKGQLDFVLIDVREDSEWQAGHLPQAMHIGKGVIERDIELKIPDLHRPLILYCGGGYRSLLAANSLLKMGYTQVLSMSGGYRGWNEQNLPISKDDELSAKDLSL